NQEKSKILGVVIYSINTLYQKSSKIAPITAYWSYCIFFKLRKNSTIEMLPFLNTALSYILWLNINSFKEIFSELKNTNLIINTSGLPKMNSSWKSITEQASLYELIYYFSSDEYQINLLTNNEIKILGRP